MTQTNIQYYQLKANLLLVINCSLSSPTFPYLKQKYFMDLMNQVILVSFTAFSVQTRKEREWLPQGI